MKHLLLLATLFIGSMSFSQGMGDITVFSNTGDKFYVVLNGIRQNDAPETNVKVTGLTNPWYECKIISANNNFTIEKNIAVKFDTLITYRITEKKGKYKLRYYTETSLGTSTSVPDQTVVTYHSTENVDTRPDENVNISTNTNTNTNGGISTTTTTTSTTSENLGTNTSMNSGNGTETVNMNVSITENGMGANVNMEVTGTGDPNVNRTSNSTETITTTSSSSSSTSGTGGSTYYEESTTTTSTTTTNNGTTYYEESSTTTTTTGNGNGMSTTTTTSTSGNGNGFTTTTATNSKEGNMYQDEDMTVTFDNCYTSDEEAQGVANQVANEAFSDDQSRIANTAAENKCMNTDQILLIANSFTFEDNKLEFLKKAYDNCTDKSNYYKVMETLTFSDDKEALQNYINAR